MSDLYDKIKEDVAFRRKWAERCGFGFELPSAAGLSRSITANSDSPSGVGLRETLTSQRSSTAADLRGKTVFTKVRFNVGLPAPSRKLRISVSRPAIHANPWFIGGRSNWSRACF